MSDLTVTLPIYYVRVHVFCAHTGISKHSVEGKIREGVWVEGKHYRRPPDGKVVIDLRGYHEWVESQNQGA